MSTGPRARGQGLSPGSAPNLCDFAQTFTQPFLLVCNKRRRVYLSLEFRMTLRLMNVKVLCRLWCSEQMQGFVQIKGTNGASRQPLIVGADMYAEYWLFILHLLLWKMYKWRYLKSADRGWGFCVCCGCCRGWGRRPGNENHVALSWALKL